MSPFDVAVIGAGPSGSNATAVALKAGLRVAQIDAAPFPRVKPCAGGLTIKAFIAAQSAVTPLIHKTFRTIECGIWGKKVFRFSHSAPLLHMISRPEFDNALVAENKRHRAFRFYDDERVVDITYDGLFHIETDRQTLAVKQLIGADGAKSVVNKIFHIAKLRAAAIAVEVNLPHESNAHQMMQLPRLDFGVIEKGYGWVFPKDDYCSVGLYTLTRGIRNIRRRLLDYAVAKGFTPIEHPLDIEAHVIPIGGFSFRKPGVPLYLVGDAAGLADAITGEGIYAALESGRLAGKTAVEVARGLCQPQRYYLRLWRSVLPDTLLTYMLSDLFYRNVPRALTMLGCSSFWRPLVFGSTEGSTLWQCLWKGLFYFVMSLRQKEILLEQIPIVR